VVVRVGVLVLVLARVRVVVVARVVVVRVVLLNLRHEAVGLGGFRRGQAGGTGERGRGLVGMSTGWCCSQTEQPPPVVCLELTARNRSAACSRGTWAPHRPLWAGCRPPPPLRSGPSSALRKEGRFVLPSLVCFQRWGSGIAILMIKCGSAWTSGINRDVVGHTFRVDDDGAPSQQLSGFALLRAPTVFSSSSSSPSSSPSSSSS